MDDSNVDWRNYIVVLDFLTSVFEMLLQNDEMIDAIKSGKITLFIDRNNEYPTFCLSVRI